MTLEQIEQQCRTLDEARGVLAERVADLQADLDAAKRQRIKGIKQAVRRAAEAQAVLQASVEASPGLFAKPKTQVLHGIQVGYRKGRGRMEWDDAERLVKKIKQAFGDQAEQYLIVTTKPSKTALNDLEAGELRKLGVTVEEAGDQVVVKPVDKEVDKLVAALLDDAVDEATEA